MPLQFTNIKRYDNLPFDLYKELPGVGHSFLKYAKNGIVEDRVITEKMNLGSLVDLILTDPVAAPMDHPLYFAAQRIAAKIQAEFGQYLQHMQSQVSYTGTVTDPASGLQLAITGRLDYLLPRLAVIDLKVTDAGDKRNPVKSLLELIEFMAYDNQLFGYGGLAEVARKYIMIYSKKLDATYLFTRLTAASDLAKSEAWWTDKILEYGTV